MTLRLPAKVLILVASIVLLTRLPIPGIHGEHQVTPLARLTLRPVRQSSSDLEITGLPATPSGFLTHADLESLPQIHANISDDIDIPGQNVPITGIPLEALLRALDAPPSLDLLEADCADKYRSHFPAAYIASHHPIFGLAIEGESPGAWAKEHRSMDPGPYFVAYEHFVPEFKVLSHSDEAQIPSNVTRLHFTSSAQTFNPIAPPAGASVSAQEGFAIAKQNCLRCHAQGASGGHKSMIDWSTIGTIATSNPAFFAAFVRNPQATMPKVLMPPNPEYDDATLAALSAYFQSMAPRAADKQ